MHREGITKTGHPRGRIQISEKRVEIVLFRTTQPLPLSPITNREDRNEIEGELERFTQQSQKKKEKAEGKKKKGKTILCISSRDSI